MISDAAIVFHKIAIFEIGRHLISITLTFTGTTQHDGLADALPVAISVVHDLGTA